MDEGRADGTTHRSGTAMGELTHSVTMGFSDDQRFRAPADVISRSMGDETVLLHLGIDQYFGLNSVGTRVWELIGDGCAFVTVVDKLLEDYDVDKDTLINDVTILLNDLVSAGLLTAE